MKAKLTYTILMLISAVLGLVKSIAIAGFAELSDFGLYSLFLLLGVLLGFFYGLGVDIGFIRNGSLLIGKKNYLEARRIHCDAIYSLLIASPIFVFLVYFIGKLLSFYFNFEGIYLFIGLYSISLVINNLMLSYLRVTSELNLFALLLLLRGLLSLILAYVFYSELSLYGLIASEVITYLLVFVFLFFYFDYHHEVKNIELLRGYHNYKTLIKIGFPFSQAYIAHNFTMNADKWIVALSLGSINLAIYSFAMIIFSAISSILNLISQALIPTWLSTLENGNAIRLLFKRVQLYALSILLLGILCYFPFIFLFKFFIINYYAQYQDSLGIISIIYFASIVHLSNLFEVVLIKEDKGRYLFVVNLILLAISLSSCLWLFLNTYDLKYYAYLFLLLRLLCFILLYNISKKISTGVSALSNTK